MAHLLKQSYVIGHVLNALLLLAHVISFNPHNNPSLLPNFYTWTYIKGTESLDNLLGSVKRQYGTDSQDMLVKWQTWKTSSMTSAGCYESAHSPATGVGERGTNCQVREDPKWAEHKKTEF